MAAAATDRPRTPDRGRSVAEAVAGIQYAETDSLATERRQLGERGAALQLSQSALEWLDRLPVIDETAVIPKDTAATVIELLCNGAMDWRPSAPDHEDREAGIRNDLDGDQDLLTEEDLARVAGHTGGAWTAAQLRRGLALLAEQVQAPGDDLLAAARRELTEFIRQQREWVSTTATALERKTRQAEAQAVARVGRNLLPENADVLMRYETHLNRQLAQTLQALERLQAARKGRQAPTPQT